MSSLRPRSARLVLWLVLIVGVAIAAGAATGSSRPANPTAVGASINSRVGPIGAVDAVRAAPGGIEVVGWALRTSGDGALPFVEITGNGELLWRARPDMYRHDIAAAYGEQRVPTGFNAVVMPAPGTTTVCADAVYGSSGARVRLGCGRADPAAAMADRAALKALLDDLGRDAESELDNVTVALAVVDFDTGELATWRGTRRFISASTAKSWWTAAALANGQAGPAADFARAVFEVSSDVAAGSMIDLAGGIDATNDFSLSAGMTDTGAMKWDHGGVRRAEEFPGPLAGSNFVDASDAANFFYRLGTFQVLTPHHTNLLAEWMRLSPRDHTVGGDLEASMMSDSLPRRVQATVEQKAGWLRPGVFSVPAHLLVAGIVRPTNGTAPFALALMATGGDRAIYERTIEFLQSASCQIYVHQAGDSQWACPDY